MTIDLNRPAERLRHLTEPHRKRRNWCESCEREVKPMVDSCGPYCPFCHTDLLTPMERNRNA